MGCGCKDAQQEPIKLAYDSQSPVEDLRDTPEGNDPTSAIKAERDVWKASYEQLQKEYEEATRKFDSVVNSLPENMQDDIVAKFFNEQVEPTKSTYKVFKFKVELRLEDYSGDLDACTLLDDMEISFKQNGYTAHGFALGDATLEDSTIENVVLSNPNYVAPDELF